MMTPTGKIIPGQHWMLTSSRANFVACKGHGVTPKVLADLFAIALTPRANNFPTLRNVSRKEA